MNILIFGDSITQGFYDAEKGGWVNRLFIDVSASLTSYEDFIGVFNLGIDSETTTGLLARIENEIIARKADEMVIILDTGGNDTFKNAKTGENVVPFEKFSQQYEEIISIAKKYGRVFCSGFHDFNSEQAKQSPWYADYDLSNCDSGDYNQEIEHLANKLGATYISMKGLISKDFHQFSHDGDHPTPAGHELIHKRVKEALEKENIL